jgi:TonB family protein
MEPVSEILRVRAQMPNGLESGLMISLLAHGAMAAILVLAAGRWEGRQEGLRTVMTISLGGSAGPNISGMTPISGRPIQQVLEGPRLPRPTRLPVPKTPNMTVPAQSARTRPQPSAATAPPDAKGRTPPAGPELQQGTAIVETGVKGAGFGLSSGGGSGTGGYLDVGDFCCPEYLVIMQQLIRRNWNEKQQTGGESTVKFTIVRDGIIADVALERSSGFAALDLESQRALLLTRQLPALPAQFPDSKLTVHLRFQYQR